jgi:PIN domain nuclease of toxin-antitoxin system
VGEDDGRRWQPSIVDRGAWASIEQVLLAEELRPNDDPFDALIVAAAHHLDLPLLTRDAAIGESGIVSTMW